MILYHGTTLEIQNPQILTSEIGRDFGFAFYTTDIREQAERWAIRRAKIQSRKEKRAVLPVVNEYKWTRNDNSEIKEFSNASMDCLKWLYVAEAKYLIVIIMISLSEKSQMIMSAKRFHM